MGRKVQTSDRAQDFGIWRPKEMNCPWDSVCTCAHTQACTRQSPALTILCATHSYFLLVPFSSFYMVLTE